MTKRIGTCGILLLCGGFAWGVVSDFDQDWSFAWQGQDPVPVSLPHAPNALEAFRSHASDAGETGITRGTCVYRKVFTLPEVGEKVFLEFETVRQAIYLKVNDRFVGYYEAGIVPVGFDITDFLVVGSNVVEVTIDNTSARGMKTYLAETIPGHEPGDQSGVHYQWNTADFNPVQGGLTGHVRLHVKPKAYLTLPLYNNLKTVGTSVSAADFDFAAGAATITVRAEVRNEASADGRAFCRVTVVDPETGGTVATFNSELAVLPAVAAAHFLTAVEDDVYDESGAVPTHVAANGCTTLEASARVSGLAFWSPEQPKLYEVKVELVDASRTGGTVLDDLTIRTGFRAVGYDPERGVLLNGKPVWLRGYAQRATDEWAVIGVAPDWLQEADAKMIRDSGANFVRWMHVAPKPAPVRACDRYGIVCVAPAGDKEADCTGRSWSQRTEAMRDAMIYFRNSPSVVFWEAGNNAISAEHMREMRQLKETVDPSGGRLMGCRSLQTAEAVAEAEWVGTMLDRHGEKALAAMRELGVFKPILELEYAREESPRRWVSESFAKVSPTGEAEEGSDVYNLSQQDFIWSNLAPTGGYCEFYGNRVGGLHQPIYAGCAILCWSDSNQHGRNTFSENCRVSGRVDPVRLPKASYDAMSAVFSAAPKVKVFRGKSIYAVASATCARIDLLVDGVVRGRLSEPQRIFHYDFGFVSASENATLTAIAYGRNGAELARDTLGPVGAGVRLTLEPHVQRGGWQADGADIAYVDVRLVDGKGRTVVSATNRVTFALQGEATFLGGYNSGVFGEESPVGQDWVNLECGVNRVFLKAGRKTGTVSLTAEGTDLPGGSQSVDLALVAAAHTDMLAPMPTFPEATAAEVVHDLDSESDRPAATLVWHDEDGDGYWRNGGNWMTNGIPCYFCPHDRDEVVFPANGSGKGACIVNLEGAEVTVSNVVLSANVILKEGRLVSCAISGSGTLTLGEGAELGDAPTGTTVEVPLVVTGLSSRPNQLAIRAESMKVTGPLCGAGHLVVSVADKLNSKGVIFSGDNSDFCGTLDVWANNIDRNDTVLSGNLSASSNAVWIVDNSDKGTFVTVGNRTHAFGSLSGSVSMFSQSTSRRVVFEIGHLGLDDELGGNFFANYPELVADRGHTIRKVGAGRLAFSGNHVDAYEAVGGELEILNEEGLEWIAPRTQKSYFASAIRFLGGTVRLGPSVTTDISPILSGDGSPAVFDDGGVDRLWAAPLPSTVGDFVKRGVGRLTLASAPKNAGDMALEAGGLSLPFGTTLRTLTIGKGTTLALEAGRVSADRVIVKGAFTLEIDRLPGDGCVLPLTNGIAQKSALTLKVGGEEVEGLILVEREDGLYLEPADEKRSGFILMIGGMGPEPLTYPKG